MPSASTTYPLAQKGTFTLSGSTAVGFCVTHAQHQIQQTVQDATGVCRVGGNWVHGKSKRFVQGVPRQRFQISGLLANGSAKALSQSCSITLGTFAMKPTQFQLSKRWPLVDVTGDLSEEYTVGVPQYTLSSLRGWATGSGPLVGTATATASMVIDTMGTVAFSSGDALMVVQQVGTQVNFMQGGAIPVGVFGQFQGDVAYTKGAAPVDWAWLFIAPNSVDDEPLKLTASLDTDGETITSSVLLYDVSFFVNLTTGGRVGFQANLVFDKT